MITLFEILKDKTICLTRGDIASIVTSAKQKVGSQDGIPYTFAMGDVVRLSVFKKRDCQSVVLQKDAIAQEETEAITINLTKEDTKIGDPINKPVDYWYEIVLNPDTAPVTIIGYDAYGEKIFRLYPEGGAV